MKAAIISIGSEILAGQLFDTNSQYFAQELTHLGVDISLIAQAPDDQPAIVSILRYAQARADLVVTTGGLGPTADDLTREAIAEVTGEVPRVDKATLADIRDIFANRRQPMPERNAKQAWKINSAEFIENLNGTAPGWFVRVAQTTFIALPGPPRENRRMWHGPVLDLLRSQLDARIIVSRTIKTIGIGESSVEDALEDIVNREDPVTATYAKSDGVHIRVTATGDDHHSVQSAVESTVAEIAERVGKHIYGYDYNSLADAITRTIRENGETLTIHEIGTAGSVAALLLTDQRAASIVSASTIEPSDEHVPDWSPADQAAEKARMARRSHSSEWGLAVVVRSPNDDPMERSDAEIGIALVSDSETYSTSRAIRAYPDEMRRRAMLWTAEFLWLHFRAGDGHSCRPSEEQSVSS